MTNQTTSRYTGFSSGELLRRARVLREIAEKSAVRDRHRLNRLALEHEDAARAERVRVATELGVA